MFWVLFPSYFHIQILVIQRKQNLLKLLLYDFLVVVLWQLFLDKGFNKSTIDVIFASLDLPQ